MRRLSRSTVHVTLAVTCFANAGCERFKEHGDGPTAKAPLETYTPGEYRPPIGHPVTAAPDAIKKPWRIEMLETEPHPKKAPEWVTIPVEASGELEMPPHSGFRCIYNPAKVQGAPDEMLKLLEWDVIREVRCSSDGFRTYSGTGLRLAFAPDGTLQKKSGEQAELELFETINGRATRVSILLRAD